MNLTAALWIVVASGILLGHFAVGADSASLVLSATIPQLSSIEVEAKPAAINLNITGGESRLLVASVREKSNVPGGYTIEVTSAHGGALTLESISGESLPYEISYDGKALVRPRSTPLAIKTSGSLTVPANHQSLVEISFSPKRFAMAGVYSDTLTFQITAP